MNKDFIYDKLHEIFKAYYASDERLGYALEELKSEMIKCDEGKALYVELEEQLDRNLNVHFDFEGILQELKRGRKE